MENEKGSIQIDQVNMFPVIKKWLYADKDIFIREIISNGMDAITKLANIANGGQYTLSEDNKWRVDVTVDAEAKTIVFKDNGIGMTEAEVKKYINQVAFSGAKEFAEKYKEYIGKNATDDIIGHFGLGFYSVFMVSDRVEINTLSFMDGAEAVKWVSETGMDYEISSSDKTDRGTEITLHIAEDSEDFLDADKVRDIVRKYCYFLPYEIYVVDANAKHECKCGEREGEECKCAHDGKTCTCEHDGEHECTCKHDDEPVNDTHPLWLKSPAECTADEYKEFYKRVFNDYNVPLFWIHLNVDYPFRLKGILYFPKINTEYDSIEGKIKLYNNQVFIADNIKEVIPEFLMVLKGVIDCPDLPLNVSRSALQNDGFVNKVADYISKKVADKLNGMFKTDRENYEKYWDDISPFIKFGCLKDEKFGEKMKNSMLYKNLDHKYMTLEDIIKEAKGEAEVEEAAKEEAAKNEESKAGNTEAEAKSEEAESTDADAEKEPEKTRIFYVTDEVQQSQYINMFKAQGQDAIILTHNIDSAFITYLEQKHQEVQFLRIDADVHDSLKDEVAEDEKEAFQKTAESLVEIFRKELGNDKLEVKVEKLKDDKVASMAVLSEENRRMQEMMKMYGMSGMDPSMFGSQATLVLNANHPLVQFLVEHKRSKNVPVICKQLYDLAMLAHKPLSPEEMTAFVQRSNEIMMLLTK